MEHTSASQPESTHPLAGQGNEDINAAGESDRKKSRARVAFTRCRRLRKKCIHHKAQVPCVTCREAGSSAECRFPARGEPDFDRNFRRPRGPLIQSSEARSQPIHSEQNSPSSATSGSRTSNQAPSSTSCSDEVTNRWHLLPPLSGVVDACRIFGTSFFQLGFLPKAIFLEQLTNESSSINVFFLLGVLSVSSSVHTELDNSIWRWVESSRDIYGKSCKIGT
jgi:hypothetical protein